MKRVKRTPHRDEGAATLPHHRACVDEAATTPRARPWLQYSLPSPTPRPHAGARRPPPAPAQVERTLPARPSVPPPAPSGFFDDPRLTPPVLAAVALVVVVATMGVLGWLAGPSALSISGLTPAVRRRDTAHAMDEARVRSTR